MNDVKFIEFFLSGIFTTSETVDKILYMIIVMLRLIYDVG